MVWKYSEEKGVGLIMMMDEINMHRNLVIFMSVVRIVSTRIIKLKTHTPVVRLYV